MSAAPRRRAVGRAENQLAPRANLINPCRMQTPIAEAKERLFELVDLVQSGEPVVILRNGKPAARILPMSGQGRPWRVATPDNPARYAGIDLDEPVLEEI